MAASTADPKKVEKVDFDFCQIFFKKIDFQDRFLCQAPRCGSEVSNGHRSEVNIERVMTQTKKGFSKGFSFSFVNIYFFGKKPHG